MEPGMYRMPAEDYHASDALSHSGIIRLLKSPAHFKVPRKETAAMRFGSAFHVAVLEPVRFLRQYTVRPEGLDGRTKEGKAWTEAKTGKEILTFEEGESIKGMMEAIKNCESAMALLCDGEAELSGFWKDPVFPDVECRCRPDFLNKTRRAIVDLKSCRDASEDAFTRAAYTLGYHVEGGWYTYGLSQITGIEHTDFYFVAVESEPPYGIQVYQADPNFIAEGLLECAKAVPIYQKCRATGVWGGYPDEVRTLTLPKWKARKDKPIYE